MASGTVPSREREGKLMDFRVGFVASTSSYVNYLDKSNYVIRIVYIIILDKQIMHKNILS